MRKLLVSGSMLLAAAISGLGQAVPDSAPTHADSLRGSNGPARAWWDVTFYDLHVAVQPGDSSIRGWNGIRYRVIAPASAKRRLMQVDLQPPLEIDSIVQDQTKLAYRRDSNAFFVSLVAPQSVGREKLLTVYYHGKPRSAKNPPWDGGLIWRHDSLGNPWIATANQGLGASVWWPNKDYAGDEPDSQRVVITVPDSMFDVSNGRLRAVQHHDDGSTSYEWFISNPINNYDVEINAGQYAHFSDMFRGERGLLTLDFWPLAIHLDTARVQFRQVQAMLRCFEGWFGPYPWYTDGYKLIEAPHLGMEHQSGVAYGNKYKNGYNGHDLSRTGWGDRWDFIIGHESAHEWWGNSITVKDAADEWVHEGFANYAEALFTECQFGTAAGAAYQRGTRRLVENKEPIVGRYGVNSDGPVDMYYKGGNMLHTIRQIVDNDSVWRATLRGLNATYWHQTVTGQQVEQYISAHTGIDLSKVFAQYLTTTQIPVLEYALDSAASPAMLAYRWSNVIDGFDMPVRVTLAEGTRAWLKPTTSWQSVPLKAPTVDAFAVDENFFVTVQRTRADSASH